MQTGGRTATRERTLLSNSCIGASIYLLGQGTNLLFQIYLFYILGEDQYGRIGLANLMLLTVIFVADLGYSIFFLRTSPTEVGWRRSWELAFGQRFIATAVLSSGLVIFWLYRYQWNDTGLLFLFAALPSAFLALLNYSAPLIASKRHIVGFLAQQIAWPSALAILILFQFFEVQSISIPTQIGMCVTTGYLAQALFNTIAFGNRRLPKLLFHRDGLSMLRPAFNLSLLGILGVTSERLTAFLMEEYAAAFLPLFLLLNHFLSGLSGLLGQFNRLVIVREASNENSVDSARFVAVLVFIPLTAAFMLSVLLVWLNKISYVTAGLAVPVLYTWAISAIGGSVAAVALGRRLEAALTRIITMGVCLTLMGLLGGALLNSAETMLWGRAVGFVFTLRASYVLCNTRAPLALVALTISAVSCALYMANYVSELAAIALCVVSIVAIYKADLLPLIKLYYQPNKEIAR